MDETIRRLTATMNAQLPMMYAHMPGIRVVEGSDWTGMLSCHPDVAYNAVYEARFAPGSARQRIEELVSLFVAGSHLPMTWYVTPTCTPENLAELLASKRFKHVGRAPGMALLLETFALPGKPDNQHKIVQVSNLEELSHWLAPGKDSFGLSSSILEAYFELFKRKGFGPDQPTQLFVGTVEGQPVSCSRLFVNGGTAGIYHVATIPAARGQGYGSEITAAALQVAKQLGCKLAILASTPAGHNVYLRLGFRDCCFADVFIGPE